MYYSKEHILHPLQGSTNCTHEDEHTGNVHAKRFSHAQNYVHLNQ